MPDDRRLGLIAPDGHRAGNPERAMREKIARHAVEQLRGFEVESDESSAHVGSYVGAPSSFARRGIESIPARRGARLPASPSAPRNRTPGPDHESPLLVTRPERHEPVTVTVADDVDLPRLAADRAVLHEMLTCASALVDVDVDGRAAVGAFVCDRFEHRRFRIARLRRLEDRHRAFARFRGLLRTSSAMSAGTCHAFGAAPGASGISPNASRVERRC